MNWQLTVKVTDKQDLVMILPLSTPVAFTVYNILCHCAGDSHGQRHYSVVLSLHAIGVNTISQEHHTEKIRFCRKISRGPGLALECSGVHVEELEEVAEERTVWAWLQMLSPLQTRPG